MSTSAFTCPGCGVRITLQRAVMPGETVRCTFCGKSMTTKGRRAKIAPVTTPVSDQVGYDASDDDLEWRSLQRQQRKRMMVTTCAVVGMASLVILVIVMISSAGGSKPDRKSPVVRLEPKPKPTPPAKVEKKPDQEEEESSKPRPPLKRIEVDDEKQPPVKKPVEEEETTTPPKKKIEVPDPSSTPKKKIEPPPVPPVPKPVAPVGGLGEVHTFDDFSVRPPKGWISSSVKTADGTPGISWRGTLRAGKNPPSFTILITEGMKTQTSAQILNRFTSDLSEKERMRFSQPKNVQINGQIFLYAGSQEQFGISARLPGLKFRHVYAISLKDKGICILCNESSPNHEKNISLMLAAAETIQIR